MKTLFYYCQELFRMNARIFEERAFYFLGRPERVIGLKFSATRYVRCLGEVRLGIPMQ